MPLTPVNPAQSLPELEERILEQWRQNKIFEKSVAAREGQQPWIFYEGPPTANGIPGSHHVLARVFKDVFPRFHTMRGKYVARKAGWDCHGLPVEIQVEKKLKLESKAAIEAFGIKEFNEECRSSVFEFVDEFERLTERIGYWCDMGDAYRTLDPSYIEQVWGALAQIHKKGLLYQGHRVVPYCPRCGTALSSHELAQGYQDDVDPSVYVRFPVVDPAAAGQSKLQAGDNILAWTTTPWTLPSNGALAVGTDLDYVRAEVTVPGNKAENFSQGEVIVMAASLIDKFLGEEAQYKVLDTIKGSELVGASYKPPFNFITAEEWGSKGNTVLADEFVTADGGTGVVHIAVAFGADDYSLGQKAGINVINPVENDGTYGPRISGYEGRFVIDCNDDLVVALRQGGQLWRQQKYEHSYPHCWRCNTHLLYFARPSWYIATSTLRERFMQANAKVDWHPNHVRDGRFGEWLNNNVDWALSRERYWGTPLPIWRCDADSCEHEVCIGDFEQLEQLTGSKLTDPHRPYVDDVNWACSEGSCNGTMRRVPEVIDVWFDSGAVPFAQYGLSQQQAREQGLWPANYICEALDQTRGWFYSLLAISVLLAETDEEAQAAYETVLCLGLISDEEGQKMSKSKGNIVVPWEVLDKHGADAFRWYFFTSKQPWDGYRFSTEAVGEGARIFLRTLWNTYSFYVLYANATETQGGSSEQSPDSSSALIDEWILSRLAATNQAVTERLEKFDVTFAGREIATFVDDLSNWYVRRNRRRFWDGDAAALQTLKTCLVELSQLLAPICPFIADEIYLNLDGELESVHLCDWPAAGERNPTLERDMQTAREAVRLGLAARGQSKLKVRQPLGEAVIVAAGAEREAIDRLSAIIKEELNVNNLRLAEDADELGSYEVKANYRNLGPRFGKQMPQAAAAIEALSPEAVGASIRDGSPLGIHLDGHNHEITQDDLLLRMQPLDGYQLEREGSHAVALNLELTPELLREGYAREIVHAVQAARKDAGFEITDRIQLTVCATGELGQAASEHQDYVSHEVLSLKTTVSEQDNAPGHRYEAQVEDQTLVVWVEKV